MSGIINTLKKVFRKLSHSALFWCLSYFFIYLSTKDSPFDSPTITKNIDKDYYYTYYTSGLFATTSTYRYVNVYRKRNWWPDQEIADIEMPVSYSTENPVEISYQDRRLKIYIKEEMKVDTVLTEREYLEINLSNYSKISNKRRQHITPF